VERLILVVVLVAVAVAVAFVAGRRQNADAPTQPTWTVPSVLDRGDFDHPDALWLVAVFTSATCATCHQVIEAARPLASDAVAVVEVERDRHRAVHERYSIDAVPMLLIADHDGVVKGDYVGPVGASELWARVAEIRDQ
jgi:hypothetical protein